MNKVKGRRTICHTIQTMVAMDTVSCNAMLASPDMAETVGQWPSVPS